MIARDEAVTAVSALVKSAVVLVVLEVFICSAAAIPSTVLKATAPAEILKCKIGFFVLES